MKQFFILVLSLLLACGSKGQPAAQSDEPLQKLAQDFWTWRAKNAPFTQDDVNRLERPGGMRSWAGGAIEKRRADLGDFETRWKKIETSKWPVRQQVDYRLIGSGLARLRWELDVNPRWKRDPTFYLDQTLTALSEALTVPAPYDEARSQEILARIENIPSILQEGTDNLSNSLKPFATVAIQSLEECAPACSGWRPRSRPPRPWTRRD